MKKILFILSFMIIICGCSTQTYNGEVNVLNWSSYIPQEVIDNFEKEFNIKVNYGTYSSNEGCHLIIGISHSKTASQNSFLFLFKTSFFLKS